MNSTESQRRLDYLWDQCDAKGLSRAEKKAIILDAVANPGRVYTVRRGDQRLSKAQIAALYKRTCNGNGFGTTAVELPARK